MGKFMIRRCRLGADPEEKVINESMMVVSAPVAESHYKKGKDGKFEQSGTSWYDIAIFGDPDSDNPDDPAIRLADLRKGDMIEIYDGNLRQEIYESKKTGEKVYTYKFIVNNFNIIKLYEADDNE